MNLLDTAGKCTFVQQPDVTNLDRLKLGDFDVVLAINVLEKQSSPSDLLAGLHEFVRPGGLLVIASNYNWCPETTPADKMIGGYKCPTSGENVSTLEGIANLLRPTFRKLEHDSELATVKRDSLR